MLQNRKSDPAKLASDIAQWLDRPLVLVGLMGVGKSTVGRRLATDLAIDFIDADEEIEAAAQMSISEIFERFGESYFRDGERRVISRLIDGVPRVIATGGGAFMNDETRALILQGAIAIWLDADIATLVERVSRRNTRPLLRGGNPGEVLTQLAKVRNPVYAQAQIHVRSKDGPHNRTVLTILEALARWHG
ncbi:shikimate kinase [Blastomonas aquatica]|uniref:Shikimate kinase n=1 Tax=Blastomonas aquatica TaxID=1510276 RepID=A0ABQ1JIG6_9SPHN|nr:shikimate kinase [Blastomonas aquatica]GGB69258.1 shikimate kinase [Blastomonas aquatica]